MRRQLSAHQKDKRHWRTTIPLLLHTPGDNMLFCHPTADGGGVSITVLFYTVGLTLTCDTDMTPWFLYLIRTADNKLYTGIPRMSNAAIRSTKAAKGRKHSRERRTNAGVFRASGRSFAGLRAEYRVKQLTKRQKERLVAKAQGLQNC